MLIIDNLKINGGLVLAPLAGYSDSPFRRIARRYGAALVFSEMVSAKGILMKNKKTLGLMSFMPEERPIGIQLFGNNPEEMGEAAKVVSELQPELIDINMGCCSPKVCHGGAGVELLREPELAGRVAEDVVKNSKCPVSAKIRIGLVKENLNYLEMLKVLEGSGISLLTVHGRTRAQKFTGSADWEIIREIKEKANIPVIGNGDITTHEEALNRLKTSSCDAVMIGRKAVGNPWIFSGRNPSLEDVVNQIKEHLQYMLDFYGQKGVILIRKHIARYIHNIRDATKIRRSLVTATEAGEILSILDSIEA